MKANVKRPARFSFKTITEKEAKHLTLIFVAVLFLVIVVLALFPLLDREEERYEVTTYAMGSYVQQTVYGENREDAAVKAADAVEALEQKISWRVENSDIQKLNNNAGKDWVTLSDETLNILTQAQSVSEKSGGAFDVTIAPISRLWDFDDELNEVPDSDLITSLLPYVNHSLLRIDETEQTASLKNLGMAVDLGSAKVRRVTRQSEPTKKRAQKRLSSRSAAAWAYTAKKAPASRGAWRCATRTVTALSVR